MNEAAASPFIAIEDVSLTFNPSSPKPIHALKKINVDVDQGEVIAIIGPSGSGKTTLLRTLNALQGVSSGRIEIDGVTVTDKKTDINQLRADVGMVFQHFNLFQHKTALENITLPQTVVLGLSKDESTKVAFELLERVGLSGPSKQLSFTTIRWPTTTYCHCSIFSNETKGHVVR